jgi:hypothetical protein
MRVVSASRLDYAILAPSTFVVQRDRLLVNCERRGDPSCIELALALLTKFTGFASDTSQSRPSLK